MKAIDTIKKWFGFGADLQKSENTTSTVVVREEGNKTYYPDGSLRSINVNGKIRYF